MKYFCVKSKKKSFFFLKNPQRQGYNNHMHNHFFFEKPSKPRLQHISKKIKVVKLQKMETFQLEVKNQINQRG
ncbi:hypothetical protein HanPI659440_Chr01g0029331 [Helianthus annuus]|nr:hypothetical protein HanPI659440_Chr01g0029331 [Helianthus annuus]